MKHKKPNKYEVLFWSIALPGFGQFLNGNIANIIKGLIFLSLEFLINVKSNFNLAIQYSFLGDTIEARNITNFQWLMFYPCLYMFAMWDAYREASDELPSFSFLPFVFGAFFVTVGLMISKTFEIFGILIGPIFLPMLFLIPGLIVGSLLKILFSNKKVKRDVI